MSVKVNIRPDPDTGKLSVFINLPSRIKKDLNAQQVIEIDPKDNPLSLCQKVELGGGAAAEYLGLKYGDNYDPATVATEAVRAFREELLLMNELKQDLPEKVRILTSKSPALDNAQQNFLGSLRWKLERNLPITQIEAQQVNNIYIILRKKGVL